MAHDTRRILGGDRLLLAPSLNETPGGAETVIDLPEIFLKRISGAILTGSGNIFADGALLDLGRAPGQPPDRRKAATLARLAAQAGQEARPLPGHWLVATDKWSANHYHWLCDSLPRIEASLLADAPRRILLPAIVHERHPVRASLEAWPEMAVERIESPVAPQGLAIISHVAPAGFHRPELMAAVAARLKRHFGAADAVPTRRIYVTRRLARFRRLANEAAIEQVLARYGFETVALEELSFADQVRLAAQARTIAGPHGAGLANIAFMAAGGAIVELRQRNSPEMFLSLAQASGLRHFRLECAALRPGVHHHAADILVEPEALDTVLAQAG